MQRFRQRDRQKLMWCRDSDRETNRSSCGGEIQIERQTETNVVERFRQRDRQKLMWCRDLNRETDRSYVTERFRQRDKQKLKW